VETRSKKSKKKKEFFKSHGLQLEPSPLETLTPALNLILNRSYDIPHSEWKGLGRLLQDLLMDMILTPRGQREYSFLFQQFTRPAGWPRIQSPKNHRGSWSLSEHGRSIVLTPLVLRCNATPAWFKPSYLVQARHSLGFLQSFTKQDLSTEDLIIYAYSVFASTASAISSVKNYPACPIESFHKMVLYGRRIFQGLVRAASHNFETDSVQNNEWNKKLSVPNIHSALHFSEFAAEYGPPMNCNVLPGELKHK
jgi:hypothetical protein